MTISDQSRDDEVESDDRQSILVSALRDLVITLWFSKQHDGYNNNHNCYEEKPDLVFYEE